jgi:hypothetical protein
MMARAHTDLAAVEGRLMVLKGVEAGDPDLNGRENPRPARKPPVHGICCRTFVPFVLQKKTRYVRRTVFNVSLLFVPVRGARWQIELLLRRPVPHVGHACRVRARDGDASLLSTAKRCFTSVRELRSERSTN